MRSRIFSRADWICAGVSAVISFIIYWWSAAPSVTLLDSGEFIVAAQHFGVPHPTGYPLWTILAWLFQLLPIGNVAHELALFSGVCGALAVGLATLLIRNTVVWMRPPNAPRFVPDIVSIALGLAFAFSFSMWSQAVIVEVYTLHALLIGLYLLSLYTWLRRPEKLSGLFWSFFTLSLAFSNHQLSLALALLPLLVLLVRRDLFWDVILGCSVSALIAYLTFALLANDALVVKASLRLTYLVATLFVLVIFFRLGSRGWRALAAMIRRRRLRRRALGIVLARARIRWKVIVFLPVVLALGLLPYAYMPVASSTNPPMNWGYTRTPDGFFFSFNRSQYPGSLSDQSLRLLSKVVGTASPDANATQRRGSVDQFRQWIGFFWLQLARSFTPFSILFVIAAFLGTLRKPLATRVWIYVLFAAFGLAAFLQPLLDRARTDLAGWWLQMPYHTYTNLIFALLAGIGAAVVLDFIARHAPRLRQVMWMVPLLPLWPLFTNMDEASQRDRWFGWKFGYDMLKDLPKGSVIFGGTDPGRFVPTYMILGESTQPRANRIDPNFDRRDLYILTQNGLADRYYLAYIRDHYAEDRPRPKNAFENWLGRGKTYPAEPLVLPTFSEWQQIRQQAADELKQQQQSETIDRGETSRYLHSAVAKWIFEKNKDHHTFYVEESFPMAWSYPHAIPDGLVYRLNPEPLEMLPPNAVKKDLEFWKAYISDLLANPRFLRDYDARKSFSSLRVTGGKIYDFRGMNAEAEIAYRQALALFPRNSDALEGLSRLLWARGEFDEPVELIEQALKIDPNSETLRQSLEVTRLRRDLQAEIVAAKAAFEKSPDSIQLLEKLVALNTQAGEHRQVDALLDEAAPGLGSNPDYLRLRVEVAEFRNDWDASRRFAKTWSEVDAANPEPYYRLARAEYAAGAKQQAVAPLRKSFELGGPNFRERLFVDPVFESAKADAEFVKLLSAPAN